MKLSNIFFGLCSLALLFGCGSGGNVAPSTNSDIRTFSVTGSDSTGATYTGTMQYIVDGQTTVDGLPVIQKRYIRTLTKVGFGTESPYTETEFYNSDNSIYKVSFTNGVTGLATTHYIFPSTINIGDSGVGATLAYSDGSIHTSTWRASDGGNGNINITYTLAKDGVLHQQNIDTISPSKVRIAIQKVVQDFPTPGVTSTLFANLQ